MPTKRELTKYTEELERLVIELNTERESARDHWAEAEHGRIELIDLLTEANKLLKEEEERILQNKEKKGESGFSHINMAFLNIIDRNEEAIEAATKVTSAKEKGIKTRVNNSSKKYKAMLPYYKKGISKKMSQTQAARHAHTKAREIDETIPAEISDRQLTRELSRLMAIELIKKKQS